MIDGSVRGIHNLSMTDNRSSIQTIKMNPDGINITDVWLDIPPVRHKKYKKRNGSNELSIKLMDRIIEMASDEGDIVFDPFGGSGTIYAIAERKKPSTDRC